MKKESKMKIRKIENKIFKNMTKLQRKRKKKSSLKKKSKRKNKENLLPNLPIWD